jgi:hypothetical protein
MTTLFDGPKSVLKDIKNVVVEARIKRANDFIDEAIAKGYEYADDIKAYAFKAKKDHGFAALVESECIKRLGK